jgi:hypothetical protein
MLAVGLLLAAAGCGGVESTTSVQTVPERKPHGANHQKADHEFSGSNSEFGREASKTERERASRVINGWMQARAATDWAGDCSYFSRRYRHRLVAEDAMGVSNGEVQNCPQALAFFGIAASGDYKNTLAGPIDSLRVGGGQGIALYHGRDGSDWSVPMEREAGKWWVAIAAPTEEE